MSDETTIVGLKKPKKAKVNTNHISTNDIYITADMKFGVSVYSKEIQNHIYVAGLYYRNRWLKYNNNDCEILESTPDSLVIKMGGEGMYIEDDDKKSDYYSDGALIFKVYKITNKNEKYFQYDKVGILDKLRRFLDVYTKICRSDNYHLKTSVQNLSSYIFDNTYRIQETNTLGNFYLDENKLNVYYSTKQTINGKEIYSLVDIFNSNDCYTSYSEYHEDNSIENYGTFITIDSSEDNYSIFNYFSWNDVHTKLQITNKLKSKPSKQLKMLNLNIENCRDLPMSYISTLRKNVDTIKILPHKDFKTKCIRTFDFIIEDRVNQVENTRNDLIRKQIDSNSHLAETISGGLVYLAQLFKEKS